MKYLLKHKITLLIIIAFIIIVCLVFFLWRTFFSNSGNEKFGNRLEGIESVELKKDTINKVIDKIKKDSNATDASLNINGRTIEIVITVKNDLSVANAKKIGMNCYTDILDNKQIEYYSIQVFIKKTDEKKNNFPIIGYKQRGTKTLIWTKNREVTISNEK